MTQIKDIALHYAPPPNASSLNASIACLSTPNHAGSEGVSLHTGPLLSSWLIDLNYDWSEIKKRGKLKRFKRETMLCLTGQPGTTLHVIEEGEVRILTFSSDGREQHLAVLGANGLVGDCGLFSRASYCLSAICSKDTTSFEISRDCMTEAIATDAFLLKQYVAFRDLRFRLLLQHHALLALNSTKQSVCYHLMSLAQNHSKPHPSGRLLCFPVTQQELANLCGISRVSVSHVFSMLEDAQIICREGRLIVVQDVGRLQALAQQK